MSEDIAPQQRFPIPSGSQLRRLSGSERASAWCLMVLLFGGIGFLGGEGNASALSLSTGAGLALATVMSLGWAQRAMTCAQRLLVPGGLFAGVLLLGVLSLLQSSAISGPGRGSIWLGSVDRSRTLIEILKLLSLAAFVLFGFIMGSRRARSELVLRVFLISAGVYTAAAFISFCLAPEALMLFWTKNLFQNRLTASYLSANTAGTFFGVTSLIAMGELIRTGRSRITSRRLAGLITAGSVGLLALTCLLLTASRTAAAATAGSLVALLIWQALAKRWPWRVVLIIGALMLAIITLAVAGSGTVVFRRFAAITQESVPRRDVYAAHGDLIRAHPLFGYGFGSFDPLNRQLLGSAPWDSLWNVRAMHNVYLQWLEQVGLVGTILMLLVVAALLFSGARPAWLRNSDASTERRSHGSTIRRTVLCASMIIAVHGLTDFALEDLAIAALFALLLGLNAGLGLDSSSLAPLARPMTTKSVEPRRQNELLSGKTGDHPQRQDASGANSLAGHHCGGGARTFQLWTMPHFRKPVIEVARRCHLAGITGYQPELGPSLTPSCHLAKSAPMVVSR